MTGQINTEHEGYGCPHIVQDGSCIVKNPHGIVDKQACLDDEDGISHHQEDLPHRIALIAVMQGAVIFIRDYPPEIPYKASLHIDNENQEKQTEKQEKDLKAP